MSDEADYIKTQWDDIHHSRNQDWRILQIIGALFIALIVKGDIAQNYQIAIAMVGLIISFIGFYVSIAHFIIFRSKMNKIAECEKKLCFATDEPRFHFKFKYGRFGVQQMIMVIYVLIISILLTWLIKTTKNSSLIDAIRIPVLVFIIGTFLCLFKKALYLTKLLGKPVENSLPKHPFFAKKEDLETCLNSLNERPLKLVAPDLRENESEWEEKRWTFSEENSNIVDKKVLLNRKDSFQFSVANSKSKQKFHVHRSTLEIYVSDFDIELFLKDNEKSSIKSNGLLIIPPNIPHKVRLDGLTYVFQISQKKAEISQDKEISTAN
jgi:hypothetical protein